jgi:hypothetical protein
MTAARCCLERGGGRNITPFFKNSSVRHECQRRNAEVVSNLLPITHLIGTNGMSSLRDQKSAYGLQIFRYYVRFIIGQFEQD